MTTHIMPDRHLTVCGSCTCSEPGLRPTLDYKTDRDCCAKCVRVWDDYLVAFKKATALTGEARQKAIQEAAAILGAE